MDGCIYYRFFYLRVHFIGWLNNSENMLISITCSNLQKRNKDQVNSDACLFQNINN